MAAGNYLTANLYSGIHGAFSQISLVRLSHLWDSNWDAVELPVTLCGGRRNWHPLLIKPRSGQRPNLGENAKAFNGLSADLPVGRLFQLPLIWGWGE